MCLPLILTDTVGLRIIEYTAFVKIHANVA